MSKIITNKSTLKDFQKRSRLEGELDMLSKLRPFIPSSRFHELKDKIEKSIIALNEKYLPKKEVIETIQVVAVTIE